MSRIPIRNRNNVQLTMLRRPNLIPTEEIKTAIITIVEKQYGLRSDELIKLVSKSFGFGAAGKNIKKVIVNQLDNLLTKGDLIEKEGALFLK